MSGIYSTLSGFQSWSAAHHLVLGQHTVGHELVKVDQQRIACRRRIALIGRVAVAGVPERQHLPIALAGVAEKVYKIKGRLASVPMPCGEGSEVMCMSTPLERSKAMKIPSLPCEIGVMLVSL